MLVALGYFELTGTTGRCGCLPALIYRQAGTAPSLKWAYPDMPLCPVLSLPLGATNPKASSRTSQHTAAVWNSGHMETVFSGNHITMVTWIWISKSSIVASHYSTWYYWGKHHWENMTLAVGERKRQMQAIGFEMATTLFGKHVIKTT